MAIQRCQLYNGYAIGIYIPRVEYEQPRDWQHYHYVSKLAEWVVVGGYYTRDHGRDVHGFRITTSQNFSSYGGAALPPVLFETEQQATQFIQRHLIDPGNLNQSYRGMYPTRVLVHNNQDQVDVGFIVVPVSSKRALQSRSNCIKVRGTTFKDWDNLTSVEVWAAVQPTDTAVRDCPEYFDPNAPGPGVDAPVEEPAEPTYQYRGFNFGESLNNKPKNNLVEAIRQLDTGEKFGITRSCDNHCGSETLVVKQYKPDRNGFEVGFISSEGIMGQYQPLTFATPEAAQRYIDNVLSQQPDGAIATGHYWMHGGEDRNGYPRVNRQRGLANYYLIPIADYDEPAYVKTTKFNQAKLNQLAELCPEYFRPNFINTPWTNELEIDLDLAPDDGMDELERLGWEDFEVPEEEEEEDYLEDEEEEDNYHYRGFNFNNKQ